MKYYKSTTEFNCGIDLHSREMYICLVDSEGNILVHTNIKGNDFAFFLNKVAPYKHSLTVCCECTFNWFWLADACDKAGNHDNDYSIFSVPTGCLSVSVTRSTP